MKVFFFVCTFHNIFIYCVNVSLFETAKERREHGSVNLCVRYEALENVCQRKYTPLYENGIKWNQDRPMEATSYTVNMATIIALTASGHHFDDKFY